MTKWGATLFVVISLVLGGLSPVRADDLERFDQGRPMLIAMPLWGMRTPWMILGGGAGAMFHLAGLLHVQGAYMIGWALEGDAEDDGRTDWFEVYAGIAFYNWQSTAAVDIPLNWWQIGDYQIVEYTTQRVPDHESLIAEVGVLSGESIFRVSDTDPATMMPTNERLVDPSLFNLAVGIRYIWFWNLGDDSMTIRNHTAVWAHLLLGPANAPDNDNVVLQNGGWLGLDAETYESRTVGFKVGFSGPVWANGFATVDLELGYLPGGGDFYLSIGNTFPIWIL